MGRVEAIAALAAAGRVVRLVGGDDPREDRAVRALQGAFGHGSDDGDVAAATDFADSAGRREPIDRVTEPLSWSFGRARSVRDARDIADELTTRGAALSLGGSSYDLTDPVGRLLFNVLVMVAEFERDLISMRTKERMTDGCSAAVVDIATMLDGDDLDDQSVVLDPIDHSICAATR